VNLAWLPSYLSLSPRQQGAVASSDENEDEDEYFDMVQTYGVAQANGVDPGTVQGGEQAALLGSYAAPSVKRLDQRDGHASLISCVSNLANTIIGSGALFSLYPNTHLS